VLHETDAPTRYLFIVARNRTDILDRVRERLRGDARIEVLTDRRYGERRRSTLPREPDRRRGERRRPSKHWDDLSLFPTLVVQKRLASYGELEQQMTVLARESQALRDENDRLRADLASAQRRLETLISADVAAKADAIAHLTQAEEAVGALIARFRALACGREPSAAAPARTPPSPPPPASPAR
jgi:hypothetical protein